MRSRMKRRTLSVWIADEKRSISGTRLDITEEMSRCACSVYSCTRLQRSTTLAPGGELGHEGRAAIDARVRASCLNGDPLPFAYR